MHGLTMIFLFVMPMSAAFFNYLIPLMIGARDVAFPRINAFSFWLFLFGGLFLYTSWFLGGAPNGGWFGYAPNSTTDPTSGMTFYALGLLLTGIASTAGAVNLGVTVINMRAPGMSFFRLPVFVWMGLVTQLLLVFSLPIITVGLFELLFDRRWGTHFFDPTAGRRSDPVAAPVLAVRTPRGVHPDPAGIRHLLRGAAGVQPQAVVRLPVRRLLGHRDRLHRLRRVGAPHVRRGSGSGREHGVRHLDGDHRDPDGREDLQLDGHDVRRRSEVHGRDAVLGRRCGDVRDRRALRRHARDRAGRLPADGHVLHRGALPLRDLRRRGLRDLLGRLLLVAQGVRSTVVRRASASSTSG